MKKLLLSLAFFSLTGVGFAQQVKKMASSLVLEERKKGNLKAADSVAQNYIDNHLLKLSKGELMTKDNLLFISENLNHTGSKGFEFLYKNRANVNAVLGPDKAEYLIRDVIAREYVPKIEEWNSKDIDWDLLGENITSRFGNLGQEMVYGKRMNYYLIKQDFKSFGKYYMLYFKTAIKRPEYMINDLTYSLFLKVDDPAVLRFACDNVMKYALEEWYQNDPNAYDTYACLLYKIGRRTEAIKWEERALIGAKGRADEKSFADVLEKMKKEEKIW